MQLDNLIGTYLPDCTRLLQELVRIPSVNGENDEGPLITYTMQRAFELGLPYETCELHGGRPNLLVGKYRKKKKGIALVAHADTVPVGEGEARSHDPFGGMIQDGKLYGRGAIDCKGGIATSLYALKILQDLWYPEAAKMLVGVDEESGAASEFGIKGVLEQWFDAEGVIYTYGGSNDPSRLNIWHRGWIRITVMCTGEEVHTWGSDWEFKRKGENAIEGIIEFIQRLQQERPFQHLVHPYFPGYRTMFTPTHISGGMWSSVVPGKAKVMLDIKTLPSVDNKEVIRFIQYFAKQLSSEKKKYECKVKSSIPGVVSDQDSKFITTVTRYMQEVHKTESVMYKGSGPANEIYLFIEKGIPAVAGFWPTGKWFHGADEYAQVASLRQSLHALVSIALAMRSS